MRIPGSAEKQSILQNGVSYFHLEGGCKKPKEVFSFNPHFGTSRLHSGSKGRRTKFPLNSGNKPDLDE